MTRVPGRVGWRADGCALWRCTKCGKVSVWDEKYWSWFGSYRDSEDNRFEWVACSSACAHPSEKEKRAAIAAFEAWQRGAA